MTVTVGLSAEEIREFVHEYHLQPHGTRLAWLKTRGVSYDMFRGWRVATFAGDLERGLIPRETGAVKISPSERTALALQRARERENQADEIAQLNQRIKELEDINSALGKAIGLLHQRNEQESDVTQERIIPPTF